MPEPKNVLLSSMPAENGELKVFLWDGKILLESETKDRRGQVVWAEAGDRRTVTMEITPGTASVLIAILQVAVGALGKRAIEEAMRGQGLVP